jgi:hypothetical protein
MLDSIQKSLKNKVEEFLVLSNLMDYEVTKWIKEKSNVDDKRIVINIKKNESYHMSVILFYDDNGEYIDAVRMSYFCPAWVSDELRYKFEEFKDITVYRNNGFDYIQTNHKEDFIRFIDTLVTLIK